MREDATRWDDRYRDTTAVEAQAPETVRRWPDIAKALPNSGRALDIASGPGAVSLWLAARGLDVTAVDASPVAIGLLRAAAGALGLDHRIHAGIVDLDDGLPPDARGYDVIVCQRFRDPALSPAMVDMLRSGGYLMVTVLSAVGAQQPGSFHAPPGALWVEFAADERCEVLHHEEADGVAHIVLRRR